jgi:hypothetical protein
MEQFSEHIHENEQERLERERIALEKRLETLIGKKILGYETDIMGIVRIKFDDDSILEFKSWDPLDDVPYPEGVDVISPQKQKDKS